MSEERRDVRAKVREYIKDGETKSVYATIGSADVSDHGSVIKVYIDTLPLKFDGRLYINKPYEKKEDGKFDKDIEIVNAIGKAKQDVVLEDIDDKPINLSEIPF